MTSHVYHKFNEFPWVKFLYFDLFVINCNAGGQIDNKSSLDQAKAGSGTGNKPLPELMKIQSMPYVCIMRPHRF